MIERQTCDKFYNRNSRVYDCNSNYYTEHKLYNHCYVVVRAHVIAIKSEKKLSVGLVSASK